MRRPLTETGLSGLACRFLWSRKPLTWLTLAGIALGVALLTAVTTLGATVQTAQVAQKTGGTFELSVRAPEGESLSEHTRQVIDGIEHVRYTVGAIHLQNRPVAGQQRRDLIGVGPFPRGEYAYRLTEGRYPGPAEFVATPEVAAELGLRVGDSTTLDLGAGPRQVRLSGLRAPALLPGETAPALLVPVDWLQKESGTTAVSLYFVGLEHPHIVTPKILAIDPRLLVQIQTDSSPGHGRLGDLLFFAGVYAAVAVGASLFLIAGTMATVVRERQRELAILRAIGAGPEQIVHLVRREALLFGLLAGPLGIAAVAG